MNVPFISHNLITGLSLLKMNGRMKEVNPKETTRAYAFEMWMDGAHAARFLENLQKGIRELYKTFTDEQ